MKVLHIISSLDRGGAEAVLFQVVSHGRTSGIEHRVVCMRGEGYYTAKLLEQGIEVESLNCSRGRIKPHALLRLWSVMRAFGPDVVQTWMYHADLIGGVLAYLTRFKPICWAVHHANLDSDKNTRMTVRIAKMCGLLSRFVPDRIVCCSKRGQAAHQQIGYDGSKFSWIPNGYDIERFSPDPRARAAQRQLWQVSDDTPLIGCVARWNPQKDHPNLFRAAAMLADNGVAFKLVLVGADMTSANADLLASLDAVGLRERVLLAGPSDDIPGVMNALDIHVLPSAGEAFPNVVAEAMACGTLSVNTDVGDVATIVGSEGWVVPPGHSVALSKALGAAIAMSRTTEGKARRERARTRIVSNFGLERMQQAYESTWREVAARAGKVVPRHRREKRT
ncbi:glycosyltransferase [Caballeronia sp. GAWG1-1]|uniref:glycosyltransferase family 4 protein n=1 Tax=Caballeronia sp. GAWG1-1 TaxID=2921742 RepID=UPI00202846ED|nr:glycosyltransferase [Caballeronia sp. GAWG1-1]